MRKLLLLCTVLLAGFAAGAQCTSSFTAIHTPLNNDLYRVVFTNTSSWGLPFTGQKRLGYIDFGDGNVANVGTTTPIVHNYLTPGTYDVGLRVTSVDSATNTVICMDSTGFTITVANTSCGTRINAFGSGLSRTFTATTPAGPAGMTYTWNFGDGSPNGTGSSVFHTFPSAGTYPVTLTAARGTTCSYTNVLNTVIYIPPAALNCGLLNASFTPSVTSNILTTTNTSSAVPSPYKVDVIWRYGDGAISTSLNPLPHVYATTGMFPVTLVMTWRDSLSTTVCRDSDTHVIAITAIPTPPNIISGTVNYPSSFGTNFFKVWLIKYDSVTNLLSAVDSQITANTAAAYYAFSGKPAGRYLTKAAVHLGSLSGTGIVPTYHDTSAYWVSALSINHAGLSSINKHIYMRTGTITSGPGFIGGNVSLGANKGAAGGVANMLVLLRDASMRIVQMTLTNASGDYSFSNIPLGAYSVYPEFLNYVTTPVTPIALTANVPESRAIHFNQDDLKRTIAPRSSSLGIAGNGTSEGMTVFPNPASQKITITWNGQTDAATSFSITSITGTVVARSQSLSGKSGSIEMQVGSLAPGLYFVHGTGSTAGKISRLVIQ